MLANDIFGIYTQYSQAIILIKENIIVSARAIC